MFDMLCAIQLAKASHCCVSRRVSLSRRTVVAGNNVPRDLKRNVAVWPLKALEQKRVRGGADAVLVDNVAGGGDPLGAEALRRLCQRLGHGALRVSPPCELADARSGWGRECVVGWLSVGVVWLGSRLGYKGVSQAHAV